MHGVLQNVQCVAVKNGKELRNRYIILSPSRFLNQREKEKLAKVFLSDTVFPVREQLWLKEDVLFYFIKAPFFWGIRKRRDRKLIGYTGISKLEHCFEILIAHSEIRKGFGVYATLLALDSFFIYQPEITTLVTKIHSDNTPSYDMALKFGWKLSEVNNNWRLMTLTREEFYKKHSESIARLKHEIPVD